MCKQILCPRLITGFVIRLTRRVPLVEQELLTLPEHPRSPPVFSRGSCYSIFIFMCMISRSLFVLLYFFFWPLCCLFFFDIRNLITPSVSSNSSSYILVVYASRYYIVVVHANRYYIEFVFINSYDNIFLDLNRYYIEVVRVKNWYYFDVIHVNVYYIVVKRLLISHFNVLPTRCSFGTFGARKIF